MSERLPQNLYDFVKRIHAMTTVERRILHPSGRNENDAEHSWHLAMMVWLLAPYYKEKIDLSRSLKMALMHDLVEIVAGDTPALGDQTGKKEREERAGQELFVSLPKALRLELFSLWNEFEERRTPEAKFVSSLDKLQPWIVNIIAKGASWRANKVTEDMVYNHKKVVMKEGGVLRGLFLKLLNESKKGKMFWNDRQ